MAGMHYALLQAAPHARVVGAFELSDVANDVYEHNHGWRPWQGNIETVRCSSTIRRRLLAVGVHDVCHRNVLCNVAH